MLGVLSLLSAVLLVVLEFLVPGVASPTGTASVVTGVTWFVFGVTFTAVGVVVARREPRNPMGWLLLGAALSIQVGSDAPSYAYFDYNTHHGALPLGPLAVLLSAAWSYGFLIVPLIILLFPDGRPGPRWRWPLRAYLALSVVFIAATLALAVTDLRLRVPVDGSGNLIGLNQPGANAWFAPFFYVGFLSCFVLCGRDGRPPGAALPPGDRRAPPAAEVARCRRRDMRGLLPDHGPLVERPGDRRRPLLPARADRAAGRRSASAS